MGLKSEERQPVYLLNPYPALAFFLQWHSFCSARTSIGGDSIIHSIFEEFVLLGNTFCWTFPVEPLKTSAAFSCRSDFTLLEIFSCVHHVSLSSRSHHFISSVRLIIILWYCFILSLVYLFGSGPFCQHLY